MAHDYPRVGQTRPLRNRSNKDIEAECGPCGRVAKPITLIRIQFDWFRGEDEVERVCQGCLSKFNHISKKHGEKSAIHNLYNRIKARAESGSAHA